MNNNHPTKIYGAKREIAPFLMLSISAQPFINLSLNKQEIFITFCSKQN